MIAELNVTMVTVSAAESSSSSSSSSSSPPQEAQSSMNNNTPTVAPNDPVGELSSLVSSLRLQPEAQVLLDQLLNNNTQTDPSDLLSILTNELHNALLESSKSCLNVACPLLAHLCLAANQPSPRDDRAINSRILSELSASLLELTPSLVVAAFLYGTTSHSLLETTSTHAGHHTVTFPSHTASMPGSSVPPSPTVNGAFHLPPSSSSPLTSVRPATTTTATNGNAPSAPAPASPEYLLQFILSLIANGTILSSIAAFHATVLSRASAGSLSTANLRPTSAGSGGGRTTTPQPANAVHHFASLVAPSVYHNPVLFGASIISDNSQTEHHQRERRVRIHPAQSVPPVSAILTNFNPSAPLETAVIKPGMITPLSVAVLSEFNRHYAVQLSFGSSNVNSIIRCCDAALRLLTMPVSSPSLQAVSSCIVLQLIYFVGIASSGNIRSAKLISTCGKKHNLPSSSSSSPPLQSSPDAVSPTPGDCRKCSVTSPKSKPGVSFDLTDEDTEDNDYPEDISDGRLVCRVKLLQVLQAARNLAELRLWPDVLAVVKAVKNTSGLAIDVVDGEGIIELPLAQPTSARAITNASFRARKLPDDIEATVDNKETSPAQKRVLFGYSHNAPNPSETAVTSEGQSNAAAIGKRSTHHHHHHNHGISTTGQSLASHWKAGKHSAAIASLQAAFRLPERLRSRRRSYGHDATMATSSSTSQSQNAPTPPSSAHRPSNSGQNMMVTAASFNFVSGDLGAASTPTGPRLELRILDNASVNNIVDGVEETCIDHPDMPMIDSGAETRTAVSETSTTAAASTATTPRSRAGSASKSQHMVPVTSGNSGRL